MELRPLLADIPRLLTFLYTPSCLGAQRGSEIGTRTNSTLCTFIQNVFEDTHRQTKLTISGLQTTQLWHLARSQPQRESTARAVIAAEKMAAEGEDHWSSEVLRFSIPPPYLSTSPAIHLYTRSSLGLVSALRSGEGQWCKGLVNFKADDCGGMN